MLVYCYGERTSQEITCTLIKMRVLEILIILITKTLLYFHFAREISFFVTRPCSIEVETSAYNSALQ
jgi:hypothetical protein